MFKKLILKKNKIWKKLDEKTPENNENTLTRTLVTETPTKINGEPILDTNNQIYGDATIYRGNLKRTGYYTSRVYYDTPEIVWEKQLEKPGRLSAQNDRIYLGNLLVLNTSAGEKEWELSNENWETFGPASISDNNIFYAVRDDSSSQIISINLNGRQVMWKKELKNRIASSPFEFDGLIFFGELSTPVVFYALDLNTGNEIWSYNPGESYFGYTQAIDDGILYGHTERFLFAINTKTGEEIWKVESSSDFRGSTVVYENYVFVIRVLEKTVVGYDKNTGIEIWQTPLRFLDDSLLIPDLAVNDGILIIVDGENLRGINIETKLELWNVPLEYNNFPAAPIISNNIVLIPARNFLYAIDIYTGSIIWTFERGIWIYSQLIISDEFIFFIDSKDFLYALK